MTSFLDLLSEEGQIQSYLCCTSSYMVTTASPLKMVKATVPFPHALLHPLKLKHLGFKDHLSKHYQILLSNEFSKHRWKNCQTLRELPEQLAIAIDCIHSIWRVAAWNLYSVEQAMLFALQYVCTKSQSLVVAPRWPGDRTLGVLVLVLLQNYNETL